MKKNILMAALILALIAGITLTGCSNGSTGGGGGDTDDLIITGIPDLWTIYLLSSDPATWVVTNTSGAPKGVIISDSKISWRTDKPSPGTYTLVAHNYLTTIFKKKTNVTVPGTVAFSSFADLSYD